MSLAEGSRAVCGYDVDGLDGQTAAFPGGLRARASRCALLPLRIFLGVTFLYAGLARLADSGFFTLGRPDSLAQLLHGPHDPAALTALLHLAAHSPKGVAIALTAGEVAVGLGTLLGLWGRLAALGGALLSLVFWLAAGWSNGPYFYDEGLPYLMAWLPLALAGTPSFSIDRLMQQRRRRKGQRLFG
jgi:thiosulfate dehydrogenase [quinone] large subunit